VVVVDDQNPLQGRVGLAGPGNGVDQRSLGSGRVAGEVVEDGRPFEQHTCCLE
jgi:hypothetical protein